MQRLFGGLGQQSLVDLAQIGAVILLFFELQDVGGALVARQQVGAVVGLQEFLKRLDAGDQPHQIVFTAEAEHRID